MTIKTDSITNIIDEPMKVERVDINIKGLSVEINEKLKILARMDDRSKSVYIKRVLTEHVERVYKKLGWEA